MLLKELEEARGRRVPLDDAAGDEHDVSSSSRVISSNLVTFRWAGHRLDELLQRTSLFNFYIKVSDSSKMVTWIQSPNTIEILNPTTLYFFSKFGIPVHWDPTVSNPQF